MITMAKIAAIISKCLCLLLLPFFGGISSYLKRKKREKDREFYGNNYSDKTTVLVMSATELPFWSTP